MWGENKSFSEYLLRNIPLIPAGMIPNTFGYWLTCLVTMSPAVESFPERSKWKSYKIRTFKILAGFYKAIAIFNF